MVWYCKALFFVKQRINCSIKNQACAILAIIVCVVKSDKTVTLSFSKWDKVSTESRNKKTEYLSGKKIEMVTYLQCCVIG